MIINRIVQIDWVDNKVLTDQWEFYKDLPSLKCYMRRSIGFVLEETDFYITIVQSVTLKEKEENNQVLGCMSIPKITIEKIKDLS